MKVVGQRCLSEREPELGLGIVDGIEAGRIAVRFPAAGERRLYAADTPVLKRVQFRPGETIRDRDGAAVVIESVEEDDGLFVYIGDGRRVREDAVSDVTNISLPPERLLAGTVDSGETFALRVQALMARARFRGSALRGFLGGRIELIPHQFYILHEVAARQFPRLLLADEVGLGKTIEACLIVQRLLAVGKARRVLILVPETLVHQWFVELLRRFNLWFSIYDEPRCRAAERSAPDNNPFLADQLVLTSLGFGVSGEIRSAQLVAAEWDLVIVDEAHHLTWSPESVSPAYALVEQLGRRAPGLLLLTATPTQLGLAGHFARLRLLDPDRYSDFDAFRREAEDFGRVAQVANKIVEGRELTNADRSDLRRIFDRDAEGLARHLAALAEGRAGAREDLLRTLLDRHGPGRVMFRNTRASVGGFPRRKFCPALIDDASVTPALRTRLARELEAEETGSESAVRYTFKDDPRVEWLASFLRRQRDAKVLLICRSQRKVVALAAALQERINLKAGVFHEGLPLVQRDRQAAWFAEPDGARILLCSEIGSEGRNFQFAHHLVLFDLPLNPGLLEQRIGRLDRIGQTETIRIHVPVLAGSAQQAVLEWYHRGLDAFTTPLHASSAYEARFRERLLVQALRFGEGKGAADRSELDALVKETAQFHRKLTGELARGRDRLLEIGSFDRVVAERIVKEIRAAEADPFLRRFLLALFDHFGVRVQEQEIGDVQLDANHAYVERFPGIPAEGMLATFDRRRAIAREDLAFVTPDHPIVHEALDLLLDSTAGTTALARIEADAPDLLLESVFVLETIADRRWHADQFLAPAPVRVVIDLRGQNAAGRLDAAAAEDIIEDGDIHRFLEQPGFDASVLKGLLDAATEAAEAQAETVRAAARREAEEMLGAEVQRLDDLSRLNDHVRPAEIASARERRLRVIEAIEEARLRLDALRLIVAGPIE